MAGTAARPATAGGSNPRRHQTTSNTMKVIYATTVSEKNYCADMSRTRQVRTQVGSTACVICPFCHNKRDSDSLRKGIVMCANDDSEILTDTQFNEANPFGKEVDKVKEAVLLIVHKERMHDKLL